MRAWRRSYQDLYVIPEVHGNMRSLELILNRILPMRFSVGQEDMLVMLGDYIDGNDQGAQVIEALINVKKECGDSAVIIRGNHEEMMLAAINGNTGDFTNWINSGGLTTISSYLQIKKMTTSPSSIAQNRLRDIIPKEHIDFISSMPYKYQHDHFLFFHGSFDHKKTIEANTNKNFANDYTAANYVRNSVKNKTEIEFKDNYIFVGAHNQGNKTPFVHPNYFALGGGAPEALRIFELNSMSASVVRSGKSRMAKYSFRVSE